MALDFNEPQNKKEVVVLGVAAFIEWRVIYLQLNRPHCKLIRMLQLHFYSNYAGRLVLGGGASHWWNIDIYPRESIKEFEEVSRNWSQFLADLLKQGALLI